MTGYDFHPRAVNDLDEIWGFIAADSLDAADGMIGEHLAAIDALRARDIEVAIPAPRPGPTDRTTLSFVPVLSAFICVHLRRDVLFCRPSEKNQTRYGPQMNPDERR